MFGSSVLGRQSVRPVAARDQEDEEVTPEDEEALQKYEEAITMLLAAGYFRARITTLSPFDKVIGGMAWCLTSASVDVDIDVGFREESTIGQKIYMSDNIVRALVKMKCPFPLQSHQIQGQDYLSLFPVIQWLVKKVIEVREEMGDNLRRFSEMQFDRSYSLPEDDELKATTQVALPYVSGVLNTYKPRRRYKQMDAVRATNEEQFVQHTLLEYGRRHRVAPRLQQKEKAERERSVALKQLQDAMGAADQARSADEMEREEARIREIMGKLNQLDMEGDHVSTHALGGILGLQGDEIQAADAAHRQRLKELGLSDAVAQRQAQEDSHRRQIAQLQKKSAVAQRKLAASQAQDAEWTAKRNKALANLAKKEEYNERLLSETQKLIELETPENAAILEQLRSLIARNEALKKEEAEFKLDCRTKLKELKAKIAALQGQKDPAEIDERIRIIKETHDKESMRHQAARELLNKRSRDIALIQRKIDDIPTRVELIQYEKRFVELYELLSSNFIHTKKYYNTFNALDDQKVYSSKELSLVKSIHENMEHVQSKAGKEKFVTQLETIVGGVIQNVSKAEEKLKVATAQKQDLDEKYQEHMETQRNYYRLVKKFQQECRRAEELMEKAERLGT